MAGNFLRYLSLLLCGTVLLLSQIACEMTMDKEFVTVTEANNKGEVHILKGGFFTIRLKSQAGTGYQWEIVNYDKVQLASLGSPENESAGEPLVGGTQYQVFRFRAKNLGTSTLELQYQRAWEKEIPAAKSYSITVHVVNKH
jgi:inhibitor of cysteine peptidase